MTVGLLGPPAASRYASVWYEREPVRTKHRLSESASASSAIQPSRGDVLTTRTVCDSPPEISHERRDPAYDVMLSQPGSLLTSARHFCRRRGMLLDGRVSFWTVTT